MITEHRLWRCDCLYYPDYMRIRTIWGGYFAYPLYRLLSKTGAKVRKKIHVCKRNGDFLRKIGHFMPE